jgi:hypothetical protein
MTVMVKDYSLSSHRGAGITVQNSLEHILNPNFYSPITQLYNAACPGFGVLVPSMFPGWLGHWLNIGCGGLMMKMFLLARVFVILIFRC